MVKKRSNKKIATVVPEMDSDMPDLMDIDDTAAEQEQVNEILRQAQNINLEPIVEEEDLPMMEVKSIKQVSF